MNFVTGISYELNIYVSFLSLTLILFIAYMNFKPFCIYEFKINYKRNIVIVFKFRSKAVFMVII